MAGSADQPLGVADLIVWPARAGATGGGAHPASTVTALGLGSLLGAVALSTALALATLLMSPMAPALGAGIGHFGFGPLGHLTCGAF